MNMSTTTMPINKDVDFEALASKLEANAPQRFGDYVKITIMTNKALEFVSRFYLHEKIQKDWTISKQHELAERKQKEIDAVVNEAREWYRDIINDENVSFTLKCEDYPIKCVVLSFPVEPKPYKRMRYNLAGSDSIA